MNPGLLNQGPRKLDTSVPIRAPGEDPWATPPTAQEMAARPDPWGTPPTPEEMAKAAPAKAASLQQPPEQPSVLRRTMAWLNAPLGGEQPIDVQRRQAQRGHGILNKESSDLTAGIGAVASGLHGPDEAPMSAESEQRLARFTADHPKLGTVLPLAAGFARPAPVRVPSDPVAEQIARVGAAAPAAATQATSALPALPMAVEMMLPGAATKAYKMLRGAIGTSERAPVRPSNPYPPEGVFTPVQRAATEAPQAVAKELDPALLAAQAESRAAIMRRIGQPPPESPPVPTPQPAAAAEPAPSAQVAGNVYELLGRQAKVERLAKAVEQNVTAHIGSDALSSPGFADSLSGMPPEWWEGMAKVAGVNSPSPESIRQVTQFFRNRAAPSAP